MKKRLIPTLSFINDIHYNTIYKNRLNYHGNLANNISIFSGLNVDELAILDISKRPNKFNSKILKTAVKYCQAPISYGGNIGSIEIVDKILSIGFERIILSSLPIKNNNLTNNIIKEYGSSTVILKHDFLIKKGLIYLLSFHPKLEYHLLDEQLITRLKNFSSCERILSFYQSDGLDNIANMSLVKSLYSIFNSCSGCISYSGGISSMAECDLLWSFGFSGLYSATFLSYANKSKHSKIPHYPSNKYWHFN